MASPSNEQLRIQIDCLKNCEKHLLEQGRLLEARGHLEEEIARLKKEDPEKLLAACRAKLIEIDHRLDALEEHVQTSPDTLRIQIVTALEQLYPDEAEEIEGSKAEYIRKLDLQKRLQRTGDAAILILRHLDAIMQARARVKRRGVLSYILGTSPNVQINLTFHALEKLLPDEIAQLKELTNHAETAPALKELFQELIATLERLNAQAKGRWSFKTVDKDISELLSRLEAHHAQMEKERDALQAMLGAQEAHLDRWIETFRS